MSQAPPVGNAAAGEPEEEAHERDPGRPVRSELSPSAYDNGLPVARAGRWVGEGLWKWWTLVGWVLAIWVCLHSGVFELGVELLYFMYFWPLIIPAVGLLEWAPKFILKRRGISDAVPASMAWLLVVHWVCTHLFLVAREGYDFDGSRLRSGLASMSGEPLVSEFVGAIALSFKIGTIASWAVLLVSSCLIKPAPYRSVTGGAVIAATVLGGLLVIQAPAIVGSVNAVIPDSGGTTLRTVRATPVAEQLEWASERYEAAQASLAELRGVITEGEWVTSGIFFGEAAPQSAQYRIEFAYAPAAPMALADIDETAVGEWMLVNGYEVSRDRDGAPVWVSSRGERIYLDQHDDLGVDSLRLEFESAAWWGNAWQLDQALEGSSSELIAKTYAADRWPTIGAVAAGRLVANWSSLPWGTDSAPYSYPDLIEGERDAGGLTLGDVRHLSEAEYLERGQALTRTADAALAAAKGLVNDGANWERGLVGSGNASEDEGPEVGGRSDGVSLQGCRSGCFVSRYAYVELTLPDAFWPDAAERLDAEGWNNVRFASGALAARDPRGNIVLIYEDREYETVQIALRTPSYW